MNLESQVCTPEQGEKLKQLGVFQKSLFYWTGEKWGIMYWTSIDFRGNPISVFNVAELGAMLHGFAHIPLKSDMNDYWYLYLDKYEQFRTEAEARAALLIYRLDKGAITAAEVNNFLQNS